MDKKQQKAFLNDVADNLRKNGIRIGWFLGQVKISATHWFFMKKGERELTEDKKKVIISFMKEKLIYETE